MPTRQPSRGRGLQPSGFVLRAMVLAALCAGSPLHGTAPPGDGTSPQATTEGILERMMAVDRLTTPRLQNYTCIRRYWLENKRFGQRAEMTVRFTFRFPGEKGFEVIGEQGSAAIRKHVFRRMLESELRTSRDDLRERTQITPLNYNFRLLGSELLEGRECFILEATPKVRNAFLFRGRVWVDAGDYAIARIEGSPAQNPSFWIRRTSFVHRYGKFGPFWLAVSNRSQTDVILFGRTEVRIDYGEYAINQAAVARTDGPGSTPTP